MRMFTIVTVLALVGVVGCDGRRELKVTAPYGSGGKRIEASAVEVTNWRGRTESTTESKIVHPDGTETPILGSSGDN